VANGWFIAEVLEPRRLERFPIGLTLAMPAGESLRLGPGTNYKAVPSAARGAAVSIEGHRMNGIGATHAYWWYCSTKDAKGWLPLVQMPQGAFQSAR
jgi:hypothetical protein